MKKTTFFALSICILLSITSCGKAPAESVNTSNPTPVATPKAEYYSDYYTGVEPIVSQYEDFSIDLSNCTAQESRYNHFLCYKGEDIVMYDLIRPESYGFDTQNGIIYLSANGERTRICPEEDCTADDICRHITLADESIIAHGNFIYVLGTPAFDTDFSDKTCLMRYDMTSGEYAKYAEFSADRLSMSTYGKYIFVSKSTSAKSASLYCFDTENDTGYLLTFGSDANGTSFDGVIDGHLVFSDGRNVYIPNGDGEREEQFEVTSKMYPCISNGVLYYLMDNSVYKYDADKNKSECIIENVSTFTVSDDLIYFTEYKEVTGLLYLSYNDDGSREFTTEEYPLYYGEAIYSHSLTTGETNTVLNVNSSESGEYLACISNATPTSVSYTVYKAYDPIQQTVINIDYVYDITTQENTVIRDYANERHYG